MRLLILFFPFYFLLPLLGPAQCPDNDSLWKKLTFLSEHSSADRTPKQLQDQVKELLGFEEKMTACAHRYDSTHAFLLQRIGSIYFKQGEFLKAILVTRRSVNMIAAGAKRTFGNTANLVKDYYNLSVYYGALNNAAKKMDAIDSCITLATRSKYVDRISLYALVEKVNYLFEIGDYERCISYATLGESATGTYLNGRDSIDYLMNFFFLKVNSLINYRKLDLAEKLLSVKFSECKKIDARQHLGTIYELLAEIFVSHGNTDKAISYFQQAVKFDQEAGLRQGCMQTLDNLGFLLYFQHSHNAVKALHTFRKALTYAGEGELADESERFEISNILKNIGQVYISLGRYDSALHYFKLAFDQFGSGTNETSFTDNFDFFTTDKNFTYLTSLVIERGNTYLQQYKKTKEPGFISEALRIYKTADRLFSRFRLEQLESRSKLFWRSDSRHLYENAIEACYLSNNTADAFYFLEKSRAALLSDQLNEQRLLGDDTILVINQLKKKIWSLEKQLADPAITALQSAETENALFVSRQALERSHQLIRSANPLYYQNMLDTGFITLDQVRKELLDDHQGMLELFEGDSAVYIMSITAKQVQFSRVDKPVFDNAVNAYISYISNEALLNSGFDSFVTVSRQLNKLIFRDHVVPPGRLIISPDGRYFPFEALVNSERGQPVSYFLASHAISYTYSARYQVNNLVASGGRSSRPFLGIAPVKYPATLHLPPLAGSDLSLSNLESYFPGAALMLSGNASKNNFLSNFYKYRIIQLNTHASDSSNTGEPVIYFSDSALYLSELIPANKPVTDLIVLSACQTASGKVYMGEGVFSFSRGFAALGIPASVTNLWKAEDQSTYRLTELLYKYIVAGLPADVALQKAKLEFIKTASATKELPFFWASPILSGNTGALEIKKVYPWRMIIIVIVMAGFTVWGLKRFLKNAQEQKTG